MPKTKQQKQEILHQLGESLNQQKAMVFVDYKGLKAEDLHALRNQLKEGESRLVVTKKTLLEKVFKEKGIHANLKQMGGQIAAIFAFGDPIAPMKTVHLFAKVNEHLKILGGYFENELRNASSIAAIATLPSRDEMLAKLTGTLAAPLSGFATVLQGSMKGLVVALRAIHGKKTVNK